MHANPRSSDKACLQWVDWFDIAGSLSQDRCLRPTRWLTRGMEAGEAIDAAQKPQNAFALGRLARYVRIHEPPNERDTAPSQR